MYLVIVLGVFLLGWFGTWAYGRYEDIARVKQRAEYYKHTRRDGWQCHECTVGLAAKHENVKWWPRVQPHYCAIPAPPVLETPTEPLDERLEDFDRRAENLQARLDEIAVRTDKIKAELNGPRAAWDRLDDEL
jgi:hypothetical protein